MKYIVAIHNVDNNTTITIICQKEEQVSKIISDFKSRMNNYTIDVGILKETHTLEVKSINVVAHYIDTYET